MNNQKPHKHSRNISEHRNKTSNSISFLKHPFNIFTKNNNNKTINCTDKKISFYQIIKSNLQMYNITNQEIDIIKINDLIDTKNCHLVAIFKDYLISDYIEEFLRRFYKNKESKLRIPKFSDYYKNYLTFFCNPIFSDFFANKVIQNYGEAKAEIYYKKNYGNKNKESKHKHKHNKEIAKTIFNTLINESIDCVIKDTKEFISTINTQETMNLKDETILEINGQNKNSNNNSIISLLKCFSVKEKKSKNKIQNLIIKKIKKFDISNTNKNTINKEKNNKNSPNKSNNNKNKTTSTIPTSARNYVSNKVNLKYSHQKNLKMTRIETSTSNNLSSNRTKNKSKDFSNSKVINNQMSNSNFSRNKLRSPLNSPTTKNINNRIFLTSNSPKKNNSKKKSPKKINQKQGKNHLNLNKYNENINLKDIMKITLQIYNDKSKNTNIIKNTNNNINNNNNFIRHQHTRSSPTINNFNININNHICLQNSNNNINMKNSNSKNSKNSSSKNNSPNSKNKEKTFIRVNTYSKTKINPYSAMSNYRNLVSNTNNDIDSLLKNNFFSSFNSGKNDKKDNLCLNTMRQVNHSPIQSISSFNNNETLPKSNILSFQMSKARGYFINSNLKNKIQNCKMNSFNKAKEKLNFPNEKNKK